jgi:hypothetical protein
LKNTDNAESKIWWNEFGKYGIRRKGQKILGKYG